MVKILLADDEQRIRILVGDFLKREGYEIYEAANGEEALEMFEREAGFDVIILDVMMPKLDGWTVCKQIKRQSKVPVIMLTAKNQEYDELYGFDIGADEYITKPFSPSILVARVKAILRRINQQPEVIDFGELLIDGHGCQVRLRDQIVDVSPKEYELLVLLAKNSGKVYSREQLLDHIWGYCYEGGYRTVDTHINRLRMKLEDKANFIKTVRGFGYKFEVEQ